MERPSEIPPAADEFYVLKKGDIIGPFTEAALRAGAGSEFLPGDFVQRGGLPIWQPLTRWLDRDASMGQGALAPEWKAITTWAALRLRHDVGEGSVVIGLACVAIGTLVLILAHWPALLWLPWFALAVLAGILAMRKERVVPGLMILLAVAAVPVMFSFVDRGRPATAVPEMAQAQPNEPATIPDIAPADPAPATLTVADPPPDFPKITASETVAAAPAPPPPSSVSTNAAAAKFASPPSPVPDLAPKPNPTPIVSPTPAPTLAVPGDLMQRFQGALVLVNDGEGSGSGFICTAQKQTRLFTNIHVVAGMKQPRFTGLDGRRLSPGAAEAAAGHDIMRMTLPTAPALPLEMLTEFESQVKIGDDILVLGNSGGGGVVTKLEGKLIGLGPDRVEVSAEFIPGNSGSPIIHVPTGKVIGIATYLTRRYEEFAGNIGSAGRANAPLVVRRFGYRLDSVARWEPVNWAIFRAEAEQMERISKLTEDVFDFLAALRRKQSPQFATETLRRPAVDWLGGIRGRKSDADRLRATQSFLGSLRAMVRSDVATADTQLRYSYFRDELRSEREVREKLYKAFDDEAKQLSSPVNTAY